MYSLHLAESLLSLLVVQFCQILLLSYENPTEWVVKDLPACVGTQTVHDSLVKLFPRLLISVAEYENEIKIGLMCVAVRRPNLPRCRFLCLLHDWWLFKWYNYWLDFLNLFTCESIYYITCEPLLLLLLMLYRIIYVVARAVVAIFAQILF